ncbi:MAG TPA: hypothetical protein VGF48_00710 [Thermoanaerobaculia bacterium]
MIADRPLPNGGGHVLAHVRHEQYGLRWQRHRSSYAAERRATPSESQRLGRERVASCRAPKNVVHDRSSLPGQTPLVAGGTSAPRYYTLLPTAGTMIRSSSINRAN